MGYLSSRGGVPCALPRRRMGMGRLRESVVSAGRQGPRDREGLLMANNIKCPKCGKPTATPEGDDGVYLDGHEYESTCAHCGVEFCVRAAVIISFGTPRLREETRQ